MTKAIDSNETNTSLVDTLVWKNCYYPEINSASTICTAANRGILAINHQPYTGNRDVRKTCCPFYLRLPRRLISLDTPIFPPTDSQIGSGWKSSSDLSSPNLRPNFLARKLSLRQTRSKCRKENEPSPVFLYLSTWRFDLDDDWSKTGGFSKKIFHLVQLHVSKKPEFIGKQSLWRLTRVRFGRKEMSLFGHLVEPS